MDHYWVLLSSLANRVFFLQAIFKRFDRLRGGKIALEDFSQLLEHTRDTKYSSSMEQVISVIEKHCTFSLIEKIKLFRLTLFNFIVGNEDMHLKNFSLIKGQDKVILSPAYDLLNTTILSSKFEEEIALPIRGKKSNLKRADFIDYLGMTRMGLSKEIIESELLNLKNSITMWDELFNSCFLSESKIKAYKALVAERYQRLR